LELLMGDIRSEPGREPALSDPTDAQLRERAKALGIPVPRRRSHADHAAIRATARAQMLALFRSSDA
jgi:hypothetical protein